MKFKLSTQFTKKRVFITGGAGALGKAFALHLAADNWNIGISDINADALASAKTEIEKAGGTCDTFLFDVSDKAAYQQAFEAFTQKHNGLDVIINNAGVGDGGMFGEYELDKWDWITGINQMAVIYGSHFASQVMKKQRSGLILTISSIAGVACMPNMAMYNVTKAAVLALMESIYTELKPFGVHTAVALPEFFRSGIMQLAKGDSNAKTIGMKKIEKAPFSPQEVSEVILHGCGNGEFYILHPTKAKIGFLYRNVFPRQFLKYKLKGFLKKKWLQEALKK